MNKKDIIEAFREKIDLKKTKFEGLIDELRQQNNDTKSSMGDKYETGREMLQQEINNLQVQLNESLKQKAEVAKLSGQASTKCDLGALVETESGIFLISVSAGDIVIEGKKIFAISPESPLAIAMQGKSREESFTLNGKNQTIHKIW